MYEIYKNLYIGNKFDCPLNNQEIRNIENLVVIHATKTCHRKILKYKGALPKTDPSYLLYKDDCNLYLNMIDPDKPLFCEEVFTEALYFIENNIKDKKVLVHCDVGMSRSPSIAMLYLAKIGVINKTEYNTARIEFTEKIYNSFSPGKGIQIYLNKLFCEIIKFKPHTRLSGGDNIILSRAGIEKSR